MRLVAMLLIAGLLAGCGGASRQAARPAWEALPLTTDADFRDLWFADARNGWAVGGGYDIDGGLIGRTRDGGATWTYASGFVGRWPGVMRFEFTAVQFFDSLSGCVLGGGGQVFRTDDGGANWRLARAGGGEGLTDLHFVDRDHGWAVGGAGVLATSDGGEHWGWVARDGYLSASAIQFLDTSTGWMSGLGEVMKSTDGGATWTRVPLPFATGERPRLYDLHFPDPQHGWAVGENGTIVATRDGGITWAKQTNGIPAPAPRPLHIVRRAAGVDTFDLEGPPPGLLFSAVRFLDASRGWTIGYFPVEGRSVVLRTSDGGATWTVEGDAPGEQLQGLFVSGDGSGWTIGDRVRPGAQVMLRRFPATL